MFNPTQLRLLQVIARTGSYAAAARELGYTQPAISYQMQNLERSVGSVVAVRKGRRMQLTAAGQLLLEHADRILAAMRSAESDLAALVGVLAGSIRLAAFPSGCASVVPATFVSMRRSYPNVTIDLVQVEQNVGRDYVRRGDADLALCYHFGPSDDESLPRKQVDGLVAIPVSTDPVHLILPARHPLARHRTISLDQLADETWIIASKRFRTMLDAAATPFGFKPKIMQVADDYVTMQALVAHGLGVALIPNLALTAHRDPQIVARTLRGWPQRHIEIELWSDMLRVDAAKVLIEHLTAAATGIPHRS